MDPARHWDEAIPVEAYVDQLWRKHRKRFTRNRDLATIAPEVRGRFAGRGLRLLVLTEPYCEDSSQLVPVVWRLALEADDFETRVLRPSGHPALANRYVNEAGHPAIPVFLLFGSDGGTLGELVERPRRMTAEIIAETRRFQEANQHLPGIRRAYDRMPEETQARVKQHIIEWREEQGVRWGGYLLDDLAVLIERPVVADGRQ
jgi:hypothetical protein